MNNYIILTNTEYENFYKWEQEQPKANLVLEIGGERVECISCNELHGNMRSSQGVITHFREESDYNHYKSVGAFDATPS